MQIPFATEHAMTVPLYRMKKAIVNLVVSSHVQINDTLIQNRIPRVSFPVFQKDGISFSCIWSMSPYASSTVFQLFVPDVAVMFLGVTQISLGSRVIQMGCSLNLELKYCPFSRFTALVLMPGCALKPCPGHRIPASPPGVFYIAAAQGSRPLHLKLYRMTQP